ncbi:MULTISPECIES: MBL fold metallo-hydrolase RNA specificity domain-containing protein [Mycolicibacterium]|uniref:MBL fold metallo-hydrolase RNA specificity domain-containing protein n=1 Tax=Mycolicibacterium TaxID=1866885 RepID=UPI00055FBA02|nr:MULTISPECIES: MBL fold metallo-hydrolase [Mycolicibacterium]QZY44693.1 MBL fold metallo-hydrolase [Mycolicibacterium austroafricanum]UJL28328.1 MBL fold metallo-hydrolase [Mycolicibacterium vanbaalenii]WND55023.1 MBL fold metallo-hydrolase [Mycolicibacterium vanbaalenii]
MSPGDSPVQNAELTFRSLGAASTVTGSKHLLESDGTRILVDCGLFQGVKNLRELNWAPLAVDPSSIDAVVVTHAHLDHTGYLPRLVRDGFRGPIVSTEATAAVADIILRDSAKLQERDAEFLNRHKATKHHPALPLYDSDDAQRALELFDAHPFGEEFNLPGRGPAVTFRRAGHILGAATVDLAWHGRRIVFTGDLGRYDDPVMLDPEPVPAADYLVMESTYGDRLHGHADPGEALAEVIDATVDRGGTVVIPAFAVGRAQALLYYLWRLHSAGRLPGIPIYLDSPMAINASDLLGAFPRDHRLPPEVYDDMCALATYTRDTDESKKITASREPKIVISASGMATGGRILHHLKAFAPDPRNTIIVTGYQVPGTRGRSIAAGEPYVKIHGEWIPINAQVANLQMLSAHADADELIRWAGGFVTAPRQVFVVHGEPQAADTLRRRLDREFGWQATVPRPNQQFSL